MSSETPAAHVSRRMHWLLQADFNAEPGWRGLVQALERFELAYSIHQFELGSSPEGELRPAPTCAHTNVICLGSYSLRHLARRCAWSPGVFDLAAADFLQQKAHWGDRLLNADSTVCRLGDARVTAPSMFVRPVADSKSFNGQIFARADFERWQHRVCAHGGTSRLGPSTEVQLAVPRTIYAEYRFWVVQGRIVTQSQYKRGNQVFFSEHVDAHLVQFVDACLADWVPHQAFVIDVCDTDRGLRIVELNTLNSAAFYAANLQALVVNLDAAFNLGV